MQAVEGGVGIAVQTRPASALQCYGLQNRPRLFRRRRGDFELREGLEQLRIFAFDDGDLFGRAFDDRQKCAAI